MKISLLSLTLFFFISFSFGQGYSIIDNKAIKMHQEGDELVQKRMYDEAIEKYKASIQREASFLESYIKWGRILLTKGKPQEAIDVAERGEARGKQAKNQIKGEFKWLKVHCYLAMGRFQEALDEYAEANPLLDQSFKQRIDYRETATQMRFISQQLEKSLAIEKQKLPEPLNQFPLQYFPVLTADSKRIIFVKRDGIKNFEHEDLFTSNFSEEEQLWSVPESISSIINTNYNEGTCKYIGFGHSNTINKVN